MTSRIFLFLLITLLISSSASAQTATMSNNYWLSYLPSIDNQSPIWALVSTNTPNTKVQVTYTEDNTVDTFTIQPSSPKEYRVRMTQGGDIYCLAKPDRDETPQKRSMHIIANAPISVQQLTDGDNNVSMSLPIPTRYLGNSYIVSAYYDQDSVKSDGGGVGGWETAFFPRTGGEFIIIAGSDETEVRIKLSGKTRKGKNIGDSIVVTLNRGETYWVRGAGESNTNDLSGTKITSSKSIAVISGAEIARTLDKMVMQNRFDYNDHISEYMLPMGHWDTLYVGAPFTNKRGFKEDDLWGDFYRVYASEPTELFMNGSSRGVNTYWEFGLVTEPRIFSADKPIMVVQYDYYIDFHGINPKNPRTSNSMTLLTPRRSWVKKLTVTVPTGYARTYFYITAHKDSIDKITVSLNGGTKKPINALQDNGTKLWNVGEYRIRTIIIDDRGTCVFEGTCQFSVINHGTRDNDQIKTTYGYAAPIGMSFGSPVLSQPQKLVFSVDSGCTGFIVQLTDTSESEYGISTIEIVDDTLGNGGISPTFALTKTDFSFNRKTATVHVTPSIRDTAFLLVEMFDGLIRYVPIIYNGQSFAMSSIGNFLETKAGTEVCSTIVIRNTATTPLFLDSVRQKLPEVFKFTAIEQLPLQLIPGDSVRIEICYHPLDINESSSDSIWLYSECRKYLISVPDASSYGYELVAGDTPFGEVRIGEKANRSVFITNEGDHQLNVVSATSNNPAFYVDPDRSFPFRLQPEGKVGNSTGVKIFFEPTKPGLDSAVIFWQSDISAPFDQSTKPYSIVYGTGTASGNVDDKVMHPTAITANGNTLHVELQGSERLLKALIVDLKGSEHSLEFNPISPDIYTADLSSLSSGVYFIRMETSERTITHKLIRE